MNPIKGAVPILGLLVHVRATEVSEIFEAMGLEGGPGNVTESGILWNITLGFLGAKNKNKNKYFSFSGPVQQSY